MNCNYQQVLEQLRIDSRIALATVIRSSGSTPQKAGISALFNEKGLLAGTIGGGSIEGEVQLVSLSVLATGISDHHYYNLDRDQGGLEAICGGDVVILIDANPMKHMNALEEMEQSIKARQRGILVTMVGKRSEQGSVIDRYWLGENKQDTLPTNLNPVIRKAILDQYKKSSGAGFKELELDPSTQTSYEMVFMETIEPLSHLIIAGAGHVGRALAHIASLIDFEITVIDDRAEYANRENIPDADHLIVQEIGSAMSALELGADTYIVIVTRGHNHDAEALKPCIGTAAAYVGMIGSAHKVEVMKEKFLSEEWASDGQWSEIHTPIGLEIGSKSVQEIAVSIAAQLVSIRFQKNNDNG